jgi:hypothetical protein
LISQTFLIWSAGKQAFTGDFGELENRFEWAYDKNGNMIKEHVLEWNRQYDNWEYYIKRYYNFDSLSNLKSYFDTINHRWDPQERNFIFYDTNSNIYRHEGRRYIRKYSNFYNAQNLLDSLIFNVYDKWDDTIYATWSGREVFDYDNNGNLISKVISSKVSGYYWKHLSKEEWSYNESSNITSNAVYNWLESTNSWAGYGYSYEWEYNSDEIIVEYKILDWNDDLQEWENYTKDTWEYSDYKTVKKSHRWNNSYYMVINPIETSIYGQNKLLLKKEYKYSSSSIVVYYCYDGGQCLIDSNNDESLNVIEDITSHISIYPNPADDQIILQIESNDYSSLVIRNITGQIVMQEQINNSQMQLDVSELESGLYLIELQGKDRSITEKIIIR